MTGEIQFGRTRFAYIARQVPRKTLEIAVHPDKRVTVKAPTGTTRDQIEEKLKKRARWIVRQIDYFDQFEPRLPPRHFVSGETHLYLGRQYRLKIVRSDANGVSLTHGQLLVGTVEQAKPEQISKLLEDWYRVRAHEYFQGCLERCWQSFTHSGKDRPRLQVKKMRTRWGSLSQNGLLTLNLSLIRASRGCIEYVITHELCHLKHADHGPGFYKLLDKVMPDWEKRKRKLELSLC
jgi:predicted metal-dependent hydrolase